MLDLDSESDDDIVPVVYADQSAGSDAPMSTTFPSDLDLLGSSDSSVYASAESVSSSDDATGFQDSVMPSADSSDATPNTSVSIPTPKPR